MPLEKNEIELQRLLNEISDYANKKSLERYKNPNWQNQVLQELFQQLIGDK